MNRFRLILILIFAISLLGCSVPPKFSSSEKSDGYAKKIESEVLIVFETSHLGNAFQRPSIRLDSGVTATLAADQVLKALKDKFALLGTTADGEKIDLSQSPLGLRAVVARYPTKKQIFLIRVDSFVSARLQGAAVTSGFWNGEITWLLQMYDRESVVNTDGKAVWTAKTQRSNFGPYVCQSDKYKTCATQFTDAMFSQLEADSLVSKR